MYAGDFVVSPYQGRGNMVGIILGFKEEDVAVVLWLEYDRVDEVNFYEPLPATMFGQALSQVATYLALRRIKEDNLENLKDCNP